MLSLKDFLQIAEAAEYLGVCQKHAAEFGTRRLSHRVPNPKERREYLHF